MTDVSRPFMRLALLAFSVLVVTRGLGGLLPERAWLAWLTPVVHLQQGIRAEEPDIFVWDRMLTVNITDHFGNDIAPTWSHDGRMAWLSNRDGDFDVYVRQGERTLNISRNDHGDFEPIWSGDGRLAWIGRERQRGETVYVWDGETIMIAGRAAAVQNRSLAWASDGRLRWVGLNQLSGAIYTWDGAATERVPLDVTALLSLSWSPEGRLAWITRNARDERSLYLLDPEADSRPILLQRGAWISDRVAWSKDGRLAWGELAPLQGYRIVVWQQGERVSFPVRGFVHSLIWSSDGRLLWVDTARAPIGAMHVWDGRDVTTLDDDVRNMTQPFWSPHGQVVWASNQVGEWGVYLWEGRGSIRVSRVGQDALSPVWVQRSPRQMHEDGA